MTWSQVLAVALCMAVNMLDGFDIMSSGLTGPGIGRIGATIGPFAGGLLIATVWSRPAYLMAMGAPLIVCAAAAIALAGRAEPIGGGAGLPGDPALAPSTKVRESLR
jgi:hypothetical protein